MNNRLLIFLGVAVAMITMLVVGAVAGGGVVYTLTKVILPSFSASADADPNTGLIVALVDPDGPAAEAGVVRGDILLELDGTEVKHLADVHGVLESHEVGDRVEMIVLHGDEVRDLDLVTGEKDEKVYLGLSLCCNMDQPLRMEPLGKREREARALIVEVIPESPAEEAGLQVGDVILSVDGQEIGADADLAGVISAYQPGDEVTLEIQRLMDAKAVEISVKLGEKPEDEDKPYLGIRYIIAPPIHIFMGEGEPGSEFRFELPFGEKGETPFHKFEEDGFDFFGQIPDFGEMPFIPFLEGAIEGGVIVHEVVEGSPAEDAGLESGDLIIAIDGEPITDPDSFAEEIASKEPGTIVVLSVFNQEKSAKAELEVILAEHPEMEGQGYLGVKIAGLIRLERFKESDPSMPWEDLLDKLPFDFDFDFVPNELLPEGQQL